MQPQPQIVTRGQDRVHVRGKAGQQPGELSGGLLRVQLVEIIDNQRDAAVSVGELREHPVGPGAQQRRLPAAGRSRDDRHLSRRRAIQGSDKITPVDQPGSCWSHRHRPALISTPGTPGAGHAVLAPSVSVPGQRTYCQRRANPSLPHCHPRAAAAIPSSLVNHRDPVTASHLTAGEPGPVAKAGTAARGRARRFQGDTVTSPATGADGAADLPDYAPIPRPRSARPSTIRGTTSGGWSGTCTGSPTASTSRRS